MPPRSPVALPRALNPAGLPGTVPPALSAPLRVASPPATPFSADSDGEEQLFPLASTGGAAARAPPLAAPPQRPRAGSTSLRALADAAAELGVHLDAHMSAIAAADACVTALAAHARSMGATAIAEPCARYLGDGMREYFVAVILLQAVSLSTPRLIDTFVTTDILEQCSVQHQPR